MRFFRIRIWIAYFQLALNTLPRCQAGAESAGIGVASGATSRFLRDVGQERLSALPIGGLPTGRRAKKNHAAGAWLPGHYSIV